MKPAHCHRHFTGAVSGLTVAALLCLLLTGCGDSSRNAASADAEALYKYTLPLEARVLSPLTVSKTQASFAAEWEFETPTSWTAYASMLRNNVPTYYRIADSTDSMFRIVRVLKGDAFTLRIEKGSSSTILRVHVHFLAYAF
ncbi:MAG TPA: hypothetical protein VJN65_02280 [Bacteroidota bacterium]|nr:hypothetical protein [Bacteroidota bacterium]